MATVALNDTLNLLRVIEYVGDDMQIRMRYPDKGDLFDLTGAHLALELFDAANESVLSLSDQAGGIALGEDNGVNIVVTINKTQTAALGAGTFLGAFVFTDALGKVDTMMRVELELTERVPSEAV
ncbi:MAG: hypothetical protein PHT48_09595 [Dechloromonas sp.]|nr:hypothetical protein [Dechloromonas sp.]